MIPLLKIKYNHYIDIRFPVPSAKDIYEQEVKRRPRPIDTTRDFQIKNLKKTIESRHVN